MGKKRTREKTLTPRPFFMSKSMDGNSKEILKPGFESQVFEELQKARGYSNASLKEFSVDEYGFFSLQDLDLDCTVKVVQEDMDIVTILGCPNKTRRIYKECNADIVVLNVFKLQRCLGIALAAMGVIRYEEMTGVITTIPNPDCSPIYLGRTTDMFATLVLAGLIPRYHVTQEDY